MRKNTLIDGVIWKQLIIFSFPILFGTFFLQIYTLTDAIIVGNFVGTEALAALGGTTSSLINFLIGILAGLSIGAAVVISHYYGAGDQENVGRSVHTSLALSFVAGGVLTIIGEVSAPIVLRLMNVPDGVMSYSLIYLRIYFIGLIPMSVYNISSGILRAIGDSKKPLYFLIVGSIINICLDLVFVVILKWGVAGAAFATLLAQTISAYLTCAVLMKSKYSYQLIIKKIGFTRTILYHIIKIGVPAGIQSVMYALSNIIIQTNVNRFGTNSIAAVSIFEKTEGLFWMIMGACGLSITTFVGQNFGARKYERVHKSIKISIYIAIGIALTFSFILSFLGKYIFRIFTDDVLVLQKDMELLYIMVPFYFTYVIIEILSGALKGAGNAVIPSFITGIGICLLRVVWQLLALPFAKDVRTIMLCYPVSWIITSAMLLAYYKKARWVKQNIPITKNPYLKDSVPMM